jgi:predicted amino acid racemase
MSITSPIPDSAENMISKAEIIPAVQAAGMTQDIVTAIQNWLNEQPGDKVPQEAFMLQLAEMAEIENHMATTLGELADEVQTVATETQRLDEKSGIAELQIQRDGLAQMQQYADMAEQLVIGAEPQPAVPQSQVQQPITPQATPDVTA